jgi:hypothetical protein
MPWILITADAVSAVTVTPRAAAEASSVQARPRRGSWSSSATYVSEAGAIGSSIAAAIGSSISSATGSALGPSGDAA